MLDTSSSTETLRDNIIEVLEQRAGLTPELTAFAWRVDDLGCEAELSYRQLWVRAKSLAVGLQERYRPGDRAMLVFPPGLDFIESFFGCLFAGLIAVPLCPPRRGRPSPRFEQIGHNADPRLVLSTAEFVANRKTWYREIPGLIEREWFHRGDLAADEERWSRPKIDDRTLAFLQYTSGTTGTPKGVMVSHGNLVHNAVAIRHVIQSPEHPRRAFWLPMYHDMGLIGAMLQSAFDGSTTTLISPMTFLRQPLRWLHLMTRTQASLSAAPDFAYALCADRWTAEACAGLDLSHWKLAVSGAEMIRPATLERFSETFARYGFRREAFQPGYGLAEATLVVSHVPKSSSRTLVRVEGSAIARDEVRIVAGDAQDTKVLASSGRVAPNLQVAIVDPATGQVCDVDRVGEIWVSGPNIARGYYNDEDATTRTFRAQLAGDQRYYLRTGDLGFVLNDHLFVAGRLKELIVIRGRNLYPQEIERAVRECDQRVAGAVNVVFSVEFAGNERLVVIQEFERAHRKTDFTQLGENIRVAIGRECGVEVIDILFVREGSIPRTTSGKVRRLQCREDYLAERFRPAARWTDRQYASQEISAADGPDDNECVPTRSREEIRTWLLQRIGRRLDIAPERLDEHRAFSEMGLGSLDIVLICDDFERWLGKRLPPTTVFNYPTIAAVAEQFGEADETSLLSFSAEREPDLLREQTNQLTQRELEEFIAQQMAKLTDAADRRAA
jgi:acyl-CoA synthetase (AMP-forming)/AMP-acid ligase II/acyl carrier protein